MCQNQVIINLKNLLCGWSRLKCPHQVCVFFLLNKLTHHPVANAVCSRYEAADTSVCAIGNSDPNSQHPSEMPL